ncbi:MAG: carbonic anhydrase [Candidatus Acidiferrum sp.]|jgi:carbonic anhydrase
MKNSRREFLVGACVAAGVAGGMGLALPRGVLGAVRADEPKTGKALDPDAALKKLMEGNARFVKGQATATGRRPEDFKPLAAGQYPEAIIVSCSDSRVAPEILFDTGIGDIFVIRVAGNVVYGAGVMVNGSIEYGVAELNVPLIMVLGHSACGAVKAAVKHLHDKDALPGAINGMVELVKPAVTQSAGMAGDPVENAIKKNVEIGVARLKGLEPIVGPKVKEGKVKIVGGVYDLATGAVTLV